MLGLVWTMNIITRDTKIRWPTPWGWAVKDSTFLPNNNNNKPGVMGKIIMKINK